MGLFNRRKTVHVDADILVIGGGATGVGAGREVGAVRGRSTGPPWGAAAAGTPIRQHASPSAHNKHQRLPAEQRVRLRMASSKRDDIMPPR